MEIEIVEVDHPQPGDIMYDTKPFWGHAGIIKASMNEEKSASPTQSQQVMVAHMTNQGDRAREFSDLRHEWVSTEGLKYYRINGEGADEVQKMLLRIVDYDKSSTVECPQFRPRWMDREHAGIRRTIKKFAQTVVKNDTGDTKTISSIEKQLKNLCKIQGNRHIALDCSAYVFSRLQLALVLTTQQKMRPDLNPTTECKTNLNQSNKLVKALSKEALEGIRTTGAVQQTIRQLPSVFKGTSSRYARPKKLFSNINGATISLPDVSSRPKGLIAKETKNVATNPAEKKPNPPNPQSGTGS